MKTAELLGNQAAAWGLKLDGDQLKCLMEYARLLASYEEANVIGTRELHKILIDHVLDSLSCFMFKPLFEGQRLADVGTGGGLPGVPIKISEPRLQTVLLESTGKKARFLRHTIERLRLEGVEIVNGRVEEVAHKSNHRGTYDIVTARAVARLAVVAEYCVPLLKVGGCVISMKAKVETQELSEGERAAERLGAKVSEVLRVPHLPAVGAKDRRLVILEKVSETPGKYPRKVGVPAKKPLGVVEEEGRTKHVLRCRR